jgi:hypothetical protein
MLSQVLIDAASAGGTAVASAMATDGWETVKDIVSGWFRADDKDVRVVDRLEHSSIAVAGAEMAERPRVRSEQAAMWAVRLRDLLEERPELLTEVQALVARVAAQPVSAVVINARAEDRAQMPVLGHGVQHNAFGTVPDSHV